jgi:hypothetical protein
MKILGAICAALLAAIVIVGIVVGGYLGGWWLKGNNTNQQRKIDQNNYGSQLAYVQKSNDQIREVRNIDVQLTASNVSADQKSALSAQRVAIVNEACDTIALIKAPTTSEQAFASQECN